MKKINQAIEEYLKNVDRENPLKIAHSENLKYYNDFSEMINLIKPFLTERELKELLERKLLLTCKYDQFSFLQSASEVSVIADIIKNYNSEFKYEPRYNGKKNPECSFEHNGKIINVEVKTPHLLKKWQSEVNGTLKVFPTQRIPNHQEVLGPIINNIASQIDNRVYTGVEELKRLDNKMKDFLLSADAKFSGAPEEHFNILVISLDTIADLDEWYSYIFGRDGVFTDNSYIECEKYQNVDAIMLSNVMCGHIRYREMKHNVWTLENFGNYLFLNPFKDNSPKGEFYRDYGVYMFGGYTIDFLSFLQELDKKNEGFIEYMITESIIFTEYFNNNNLN